MKLTKTNTIATVTTHEGKTYTSRRMWKDDFGTNWIRLGGMWFALEELRRRGFTVAVDIG